MKDAEPFSLLETAKTQYTERQKGAEEGACTRTAEPVCGNRHEVFKQLISALFDGKDHSTPDDLLNPIFRVSDSAESPT